MMRRQHNPNGIETVPQEEPRQDWKRARHCAYQRGYRARNLGEERARKRRYYQDNPEYFRARDHNRRAAVRDAGSFTPQEWHALCARYGDRCLACGRKPDALTPDHVIPIARGGANTIANLQPLCLGCNLSKHARTIDYRQSVSPETV